MQRDIDLLRASVPLYSCPLRVQMDPDFQVNSVMSYLMQSEKYEDKAKAWAAAIRIVAKCRKTTERRAES